MKTLVIHPKDRTTDMLCAVYQDMNCTIVRNQVSKSELKRLISSHDRIIMMGHGTALGLFGFGGYVINSDLVYLLREKKETVYIWCNADEFVKKYDLKGLYSGMIISEKEEAEYCNVECSYKDVNMSNNYFSDALTECVAKNYSLAIFHDNYIDEDGDNPVMVYNRERMFYKK